MQTSNKGAPGSASPRVRVDGAELLAARVLDGALGFVVRCTPRRQTLRVEAEDGDVYVKLRSGRLADARAEWRWLGELGALGLTVAQPLALVVRGRRSALATRAVAGRPCDAWFDEVGMAVPRARAVAFACGPVARAVAQLHAAGLVYRDLYWNHVFTERLAPDGAASFLDVERVFRPRFRFERWRTKDLAGLRSSLPTAPTLREVVRFLRAYCRELPVRRTEARVHRRRWIAAAGAKAARIAAHRPKYG